MLDFLTLTHVPVAWLFIIACWASAMTIFGMMIAFVFWRRHAMRHGFFVGDEHYYVLFDHTYGTEMGSMVSACRERGLYL